MHKEMNGGVSISPDCFYQDQLVQRQISDRSTQLLALFLPLAELRLTNILLAQALMDLFDNTKLDPAIQARRALPYQHVNVALLCHHLSAFRLLVCPPSSFVS